MSESYEYGLGDTTLRWRELAIQHLPNLQEVILAATSHVDLWQCLKEFLSEAGVGESQKAEIESIYNYAWWCFAISGDQDLATEVGTYFYEDLPVHSDFDEQVQLYITPPQFERLESCFRYRQSDEEYADFCSRYYVGRAKNTMCSGPVNSKKRNDRGNGG